MIPFNVPPFLGTETDYIVEAIKNQKICGDGKKKKKCHQWLEEKTGTAKALLTTSCTHSLEMAALLLDIKPGDEVILPSFTFCSTADAFALRGAKLVFVDIRPDTMNIDEKLIEDAITEKTKAIVPVHYAGVACEMDAIMDIAKRHGLKVVEDAAQAVMSEYKGQALGTIGDFGCYSFHETKNYSMGEGGALLIKDGGLGSSYLPSDMNAAYLWAQLQQADMINENRLASWQKYYDAFEELEKEGFVQRPIIPEGCKHNAHMFYLKAKDLEERTALISFLKENGVMAVFHYIPLHSAPAGQKFGVFHGEDRYTTSESDRLLRLPMYYNLTDEDINKVIDTVIKFYKG